MQESIEPGKENNRNRNGIKNIKPGLDSSQEIRSMIEDEDDNESLGIRGASVERFEKNEYYRIPLEANMATVRGKDKWFQSTSQLAPQRVEVLANLTTYEGMVDDDKDGGTRLLDDMYRRNEMSRHFKSRDRIRAVFERQSNWFKDMKNQVILRERKKKGGII